MGQTASGVSRSVSKPGWGIDIWVGSPVAVPVLNMSKPIVGIEGTRLIWADGFPAYRARNEESFSKSHPTALCSMPILLLTTIFHRVANPEFMPYCTGEDGLMFGLEKLECGDGRTFSDPISLDHPWLRVDKHCVDR